MKERANYKLWLSEALLAKPASIELKHSLVSNDKLRSMFPHAERELLGLSFGDVSPDEDFPGKNPFDENGTAWTGGSRHIGYHCLAVAAVARAIGEMLAQSGSESGLSESDLSRLVSTALLHDSLKRLDILCMRSGRPELRERKARLEAIRVYLIGKGCPAALAGAMLQATEDLCDDAMLGLTSLESGTVKLKEGHWVKKILLLSDAMTATNYSGPDPRGETRVLRPYQRILHTQLLKRAEDITAAFYIKDGRVIDEAAARDEGGDFLAGAEEFLAWFAEAIAVEIAAAACPEASAARASEAILDHVRASTAIFG